MWLASRLDTRVTTRTRVDGIIRNRIAPVLATPQLGSLTRLQVQQWAAQLHGPPDSVRRTVNVLSGALQLAVEDGRLSSNPARRLKLPRAVKSGKRYLTHDQVAAPAKEVGARSTGTVLDYDMAVLVLACCGLRWGELAGLRASSISNARVSIRR